MQFLRILFLLFLSEFISANLYSEFNRKQEKVSNYAQKRLHDLSSASLDNILESNSKLIKNNFNFKTPRNSNNENRDFNIKKIYRSSLPYENSYHENNLNYNNWKFNEQQQFERDKKSKVINDNDVKWIKQNPVEFAKFLKRINRKNHESQCHRRQNRIQNSYLNENKSKHKTKRQTKRDNQTPSIPLINPNPVMNSNPSMYPGVIMNTPDLTRYKEIVNNQFGTEKYNPLVNQIKQNPTVVQTPFSPFGNILNLYDQNNSNKNFVLRDNNKETNNTTKIVNQNVGEEIGNSTKLQKNVTNVDCSQIIDPNNVTAVLERVLQELELIRETKEGNSTPEGMPCDIIGSWNSEIIGMRFDINVTNGSLHNLDVRIVEHSPPKRITLMDTNWTCSGFTLHNRGGPFYISASKKKEEVLATFTGICKTCGGIDTIFGTWSIVHPAKDCRDLQVSIETKRDIFRKETLHLKRLEKLEKIKNGKSKTEPTVMDVAK